jgi:DNA-binding LytR/AlgR family response regulator
LLPALPADHITFTQNFFRVMNAGDIVRVEIFGDKSFVFLQDGRKTESSENFDYLEDETTDGIFLHIHPRHLINLFFVSKIHLGDKPSVEMSDGSMVPVQTGKQSDLLTLFENYFQIK